MKEIEANFKPNSPSLKNKLLLFTTEKKFSEKKSLILLQIWKTTQQQHKLLSPPSWKQARPCVTPQQAFSTGEDLGT